jgi:peptidoglycan LD-endopeptidase CwlK
MPSFGPASDKRKNTCRQPIRRVLDLAIQVFDFSVLCGIRGKKDQHQAFVEGNSKLDWPSGQHNNSLLPEIPDDLSVLAEDQKSHAVDVQPYPAPIDTDELTAKLAAGGMTRKQILALLHDWARTYYLAGLLKGIAHALSIPWRQGINWDGDSDFEDQTFDDAPHNESR